MKRIFTYDEMVERRGCYDLTKAPQHEWLHNNPIQLSDMLNDPRISITEKSWFISNSCNATVPELDDLALRCAEAVLPLWKARYSGPATPSNAALAEPKLALIPQAFYAIQAKDRIFAAAKAAEGTPIENSLLNIFQT